jgi:hypothetical protein
MRYKEMTRHASPASVRLHRASLIPSSPPTCLFNRPRTTNRSDKLPAIEVYNIQSSEPPGGIGEPGTSGIAPVVTNAIFAATGKRLRKLPFDAAALKQM